AKGAPNPQKDIQHTEKTAKTKDEVVKALKASFDYCDGVFNNLTDAILKETYKEGDKDLPKVSMITLNIYHGGEHYGNMVVYLRMKGIVPPSSESAPQERQSQPKTETKPPQFDNEQYQFNTESAEEAKAWSETDPLVKAGWMIVEIHPWLVAKEVWP